MLQLLQKQRVAVIVIRNWTTFLPSLLVFSGVFCDEVRKISHVLFVNSFSSGCFSQLLEVNTVSQLGRSKSSFHDWTVEK